MMICVILAGGKGTRLQTVVKNVPKPMAEVSGKPFLDFILSYYAMAGATEFVLCVSYLRQCIMKHIGNSFHGIPVRYSVENEPLGTGGAIWNAFMNLAIPKALVANGDTFIEADYKLFNAQCQGLTLGMLLTYVEDTSRFGRVETEGDRVVGFVEKGQARGPGRINAGVYHIERELLAAMPKSFSFESDFLMPRIKQIRPKFVETNGYFIDIGLPESYAKACQDIPRIAKKIINA